MHGSLSVDSACALRALLVSGHLVAHDMPSLVGLVALVYLQSFSARFHYRVLFTALRDGLGWSLVEFSERGKRIFSISPANAGAGYTLG